MNSNTSIPTFSASGTLLATIGLGLAATAAKLLSTPSGRARNHTGSMLCPALSKVTIL